MICLRRSISPSLSLVLSIALLCGCGDRATNAADLAGRWEFKSRGDRALAFPEESQGALVLKADGTFSVTNVSGTVLKRTDTSARQATGRWEIGDRPRLGPFDRTVVEMRFDDQGTPFRAYISEAAESATITFARDEEAGDWVKFRKVGAKR